MVKLSNKGKGKPSKRKTLKTKYKIDRKVKLHKKKLRKEMRKLGTKNIKPKKSEKGNTLPNSFPFKAQILEHYKSQRPTEPSIPVQKLQPAEWGLIAVENRSIYLPKDKDHLTKKYLTNPQKLLSHATLLLLTVDARNIEACLDKAFEEECKKRGIKIIFVVCKIDTISERRLAGVRKVLEDGGREFGFFSMEQKKRALLLDQLFTKLKESAEGMTRCAVVGKANTGKHTLIKQFMKLAKFHNEDYSTLTSISLSPNLYLLDTPYKLPDSTLYPLFHLPQPVHEDSLQVQQQRIMKYLFVDNLSAGSRNQLLMHYGVQDFVSVDDLLKKVGKVRRVFGKGGMVNTAEVRTSMLADWYQGKLNHIF